MEKELSADIPPRKAWTFLFRVKRKGRGKHHNGMSEHVLRALWEVEFDLLLALMQHGGRGVTEEPHMSRNTTEEAELRRLRGRVWSETTETVTVREGVHVVQHDTVGRPMEGLRAQEEPQP